jgi:response regulator RpfG family c-di-GMP phosphodiesterase
MSGHEPKYQLLVVDDEIYICNIVTEALSSSGEYQVVSFSKPKKALAYIEKNQVDLVLTDLVMGDYSGVEILDKALECHPDCIVILMTAFPTVNNAISVLKKGAYDYLIKPFKLETLKSAVKRGLERQSLTRENLHLKEQLGLYQLSEAMGSSTTLESMLNLAVDAAKSIIGVGAVSILVKDPSSLIPVPYVIKGKPPDAEAADLLLGKHDICRVSLQESSAQTISKKIKGKQPTIRTLAANPLMNRGNVIGLLNVVRDDCFMKLTPGQMHLLSIISSKVASVLENNRLYEHLQSSYLTAIKALANAIEARDWYTRGHTERVTILADLIASRLGWSEKKRAELKMGCTLHDIGKIGVPDAILNKPNALSDEEREQMEAHPQLGARIIDGIDYLRPAIPYVLYHHERYDGKGYPHGLSGEDIPIEGRLLSVVDTYDAIVSERPYRKMAPPEKAIRELEMNKCKQFDPQIVDVLIAAWKERLIEQLGIYEAADETVSTT